MLETYASLRNKHILVTGGMGFIGSNIAHECLKHGAHVTIYDCLDPRSGGNMQNLNGIEESVKSVINDVRNFEPICHAILKQDIVFHCAAYTSHPQSMKDPLVDIDVNCKGTVNVLEAARRFNPDIKIVYVATSTQIGKMYHDVIDEMHPEFPLDIYSANKSVAEKYMLIYGKAYQMRTTVVRLANTYGPRSNIKSPDFGFMNYFIGLALQDKPITVFGDGAQTRNVNYVEDTVDALLLAAVNEKSNHEVYFAVSDEHLTVADIAEGIKAYIGGDVRYVEWPNDREFIEIGDVHISNHKMTCELGWSPKHNLKSGLIKTKAYYETCLDKYTR
jgi:UDP-glucose 4-epimerase